MLFSFFYFLIASISTHPTQPETISTTFHRLVTPHSTVPDIPEGPTVWEDEAQMRDRMAHYAKEKFSKEYHYWKPATEIQSKRVKQDPVTVAVISGIIGMTTQTVQNLVTAPQSSVSSSGGCAWFGTAPFCRGSCPVDHDLIRSHNGRCSNWWMSGSCVPDQSFGKPCSPLFDVDSKKSFCCKSDPMECTWSGHWMGANTAHNIYCSYDNAVGRCGALDCSINNEHSEAQSASDISGERCDRLQLFGFKGKATCGYIKWFDENGATVDSWYKSK